MLQTSPAERPAADVGIPLIFRFDTLNVSSSVSKSPYIRGVDASLLFYDIPAFI